jgi:hypothetical protein
MQNKFKILTGPTNVRNNVSVYNTVLAMTFVLTHLKITFPIEASFIPFLLTSSAQNRWNRL